MRRASIFSVSVLAVALTGCVTKQYGRQAELADTEKQRLDCPAIDQEVVKLDRYVDWVNKKSEYDGWDVLAILGDFGVGNAIERGEALKAAELRKHQLVALGTQKACVAQVAGPGLR